MKTICKVQLITALVATLFISSLANAQVIISDDNSTSGSSSAVLDIISGSGDKGLLIPRIDIPSLSAATPVTSPAIGLLVYNINGTTGPGFFYWNGSEWTALGGSIAAESDPVFTAWDKDYADLTNKPTIPNVPTNVGAFSNDAGYITTYSETDPVYTAWDKDYGDLTNKPTIPVVPSNVSAFSNDAGYITTYSETDPEFTAWDKDYEDLTNKPTLINSQWLDTGSDIYFNSGKVGIGTIAPEHKLAVSGDGSSNIGVLSIECSNDLEGSYVWASSAMSFLNPGGNVIHMIGREESVYNSGYIGFNYQGAGSTSNFLTFGLFNVNNVLNITGASNVGIGTTSPLYKLDVNGAINGTSVLVNGVPVASSTDTYWSTAGSGKIQYSGGNVGVGIASPSYALDVSGDVNVTGNFRINGAPLTGTGTVTSISVSGGTSGLSFSGGPITTSGTLTLGGTLAIANGGTNSTTASGARTNLGATAVGSNIFTLANPSDIRFIRINADNSVSALTASDFRTAIGAGTGTGTVTSVLSGNGMSFSTITGTGTITMGTPSSLSNTTTNAVTATSHTHAVTTVLPSSSSTGIMTASGTKTAGGFYGGTTAPTSNTRLNYDGYMYATRIYEGTNRVYSAANNNIGTGATNYAAGNHTHSDQTPPGVISQYAGATAPDGYLLCEGQAVSRTTYSALFAVIGTTYGAGDGSTTFNVPNLKGKIPVGLNSSDVSFDARGETGGEKTHSITTAELPSHNHSFTGTAHSHTVDPEPVSSSTTGAHTHTVSDRYNTSELSDDANDRTVGSDATTTITRTTSSSGSHSHTIDIPSTTSSSTTATGTIGNTGSGTAMNVLQPYIVLYYIIKY